MRNRKILATLLATGLSALSLSLIPIAAAQNEKNEQSGSADKQVEQTSQDQISEKREQLLQQATAAVRESQNALTALDEKNSEEAIAALERAIGKLEIILARDPELMLAPSDVSAVTYDVLASIEAVREARDQAEAALDAGRVQEARRLIRNLASETVISTTNIPLATYPDAIRRAVRLVDEEKTEEAKAVLQTALNTLVITDVIIPLPVVAAENLLEEAEGLAENADRSKEENKRLGGLLEDARTELEFAQALGYGSKEDFSNLFEQLDEIEKKTEGGKSGSGFFDDIKEFLGDALDSSQPEKSGNSNTSSGSSAD